MSDEELAEQELLAVFTHYGLPTPRYGEHPFRCPVHDDRVASASVNRRKGVWNCHACGAGGDAVTLVMEMEHLTAKEALGFLGELTGTEHRRGRRPAGKSRRMKRWTPRRRDS